MEEGQLQSKAAAAAKKNERLQRAEARAEAALKRAAAAEARAAAAEGRAAAAEERAAAEARGEGWSLGPSNGHGHPPHRAEMSCHSR